jgi:hypothetical protein
MSSTDSNSKSEGIIDKIYGSLQKVASSTSSTLSSSVQSGYNSLFEGSSLYIGLIVVVIVCVLIAYLLYYLITTRVFLQSVIMAEETKSPVVCTEKQKYKFVYDKTGNGERRSFTFWIYVHDMNKYKGMYKNVFNITSGEKNTDLTKMSPFVFLDKDNNRMYVRFGSSLPELQYNNYSDLTDTTLGQFMKQGIVIPYIPLQRWVHIGIVCNANSYKNYIYAYVDGDLVNSTSTGEIDNFITNSARKDLRNLDMNVNGYLNIGGNNNDFAEGPGFSGLVSKITTYNYELNQKDIFADYYKGPIGGFLSKIGLSNYRVRNPIYKI